MFELCNKTQDLSAYNISSKDDKTVEITTISCSLSILGAFGIFWTYYKIPEIQKFVRKLVVWLTVADLLTASGYMVAAFRHFFVKLESTSCELCIIQSFITTYSSLVSFFLTMAIALHVFLTVYNKRPVTGSRGFMILFNGISWLVPGIIVVIALNQNALGEDVTPSESSQVGTGPWCWINTNRTLTNGSLSKDSKHWMFVTGKGWELMCYLVTTSLYVLLKLHLYLNHRNVEFQNIHKSLRREDKNFLLVFLVLYAIRIWGTIRFFLFLFDPNNSTKALGVLEKLQAFGDPSQAFFNFCLFCLLDRTVRRHMFTCFKSTNDEVQPLLQNKEQSYDANRYDANKGCVDQPSPSLSSKNSEADDQIDEPERLSVQK